MNDLISIIIPCYNVGEYLEKCLDSILAQTYPNLEIVCVNDGSTDNTANVIDAYAEKDSRVRAIHKENGGVTSARLRGIAESQGEWIGFVDGDDIIDADMYQRLMDNVKDESIDISHCGYKKIFPSGNVEYYYNTENHVQQDNATGVYDLLEGSFVEPGIWNKLYRKSLFEGLFDWLNPTIKINEDLLMNFYLFRKARNSVYEGFCPYHYVVRVGSASASMVNENKLYDPIRIMDILLEETQGEEALQSVIKNRLAYLLINGATRGVDNGQKGMVKHFIRYARKRLRKARKEILADKTYSKKMRYSVRWVCFWPASYRFVHVMHLKLTGKYKKYKEIYPWL